MTNLFVPAVSVVAALVLAVAAGLGSNAVAVAVAVLILAMALGWPALLDLRHAQRSTSVVIAVSGLAAAALALSRAGQAAPLVPFAGLMAGCVMAAFVHQMLRRDGRLDLIPTLTATVSGQVLTVLGTGWILLPQTRVGSPSVVVAAVAVVVAVGVVAAPIDPVVRGWAAFGVSSVIAVITAAIIANTALVATALVGVAVAAVASGTAVLFHSMREKTAPLAIPAAGIAPVCAVGIIAYAVARLAGG